MKIGLVLFPIWGMGGLATDVGHYQRILGKAGHQVDFWMVSYTGRRGNYLAESIKYSTKQDGPFVRQGELSIANKDLKESIKILNRYDILIFLHPCPHVTDKQKSVGNWRKLYTDTKARKIVRFTDVYLEKLYPWILEVKDAFEPWATNMGQVRWVQKYIPECQLSTFPVNFNAHSINFTKNVDLVWPCAWRGWKGIKQFVKALPNVEGSVELYGSGRELRQLRKVGNPYAVRCHGAVLPKQMIRAFMGAHCSADLTGWSKKYWGHNNRSVIEPMFLGAVSCVLPTMVHPFNEIPPECVYEIDKEDIAESFNHIIGNKRIQSKIAKEAFEWVQWRYDPQKVVAEVIDGIA